MSFLSFNLPLGAAFLIYIVKAAVVLALFYVLYRLLLRNETFHRMNRAFLLGMMILSFVLPLCKLTIHREAGFETQAPVHSIPASVATSAIDITGQPAAEAFEPESTGNYTYTHTQYNLKGDIANQEVLYGDEAKKAWADSMRKDELIFLAAYAIWLAGFIFHLSRTLVSIGKVRRFIKRGHLVSEKDGIRTVVSENDTTPFSWMKTIVLSRADYGSESSRIIIEHETAHVRLRHSLDILAINLLSSLQWFNPVIALLRRDLQNVHEFQADNLVLEAGYEPKCYQYMLLGKIASINGFSVANHFKKINLSNRITMMNRKKSNSLRSLKALYAPLLIGIVLAAFAVTVYDCAPKENTINREEGDFAFRKATRNMFGDSISVLDARYGQGKFSAFPLGTAFLNILPDSTAIVNIGENHQELEFSKIPSYLAGLADGLPIYRCVIRLDKMGEKNLTANGLTSIKPLLESLEEQGIRSIVVATEAESRETYYSTYKYARIYALDNGTFVFDHNGLEVCGDISTMIEWVTLLDIEYVAYFPDNSMTWADASRIMNIALERGSRTFFICEPMAVNKYSSLTSILATIQQTGNGELSRKMKEKGKYKMAVLPTRPESTGAFNGHTMHEVLYMLTDGIIDGLCQKAGRVIDKPEWFYSEDGSMNKLIFCDDRLIMVCSSSVGRNVWIRPDISSGIDSVMSVIADGKRYRMTSIEEDAGLCEFAEYPWKEEYSYANGSLCWVPEGGDHTWMFTFEPVPADAVQFDIVEEKDGMRNYLYRGVKVSDKDDRFDDIRVVNGMFLYANLNINGAYGPNQAYITRVESGRNSTRLFLNVIIRSTFTFPGYVGSDFSLTFKDGTKLDMTGAEGVPLDTEFNRGGDHMEMNIIMEFPPFDITELEMTEDGQYPAVLQGDICHTQVSLDLGVSGFYLNRQ